MLVCWLLWFFMLLFNVSSLPLMFYVDFPLAFTLIVCFNEGELLLKLLGFYVLVCWSSV